MRCHIIKHQNIEKGEIHFTPCTQTHHHTAPSPAVSSTFCNILVSEYLTSQLFNKWLIVTKNEYTTSKTSQSLGHLISSRQSISVVASAVDALQYHLLLHLVLFHLHQKEIHPLIERKAVTFSMWYPQNWPS